MDDQTWHALAMIHNALQWMMSALESRGDVFHAGHDPLRTEILASLDALKLDITPPQKDVPEGK